MIFYNCLRIFLLICAFPYFVIKREFLKKRIFSYRNIQKDSNKEYIWINLSSVGEVNVSEPLINRILENRDENILITVMTDTGMETAKNKYAKKERVNIIYFPLDFKFAVKKIVKKLNIKILILIETEIWPNLISVVSKKSKVVLVNGRISDKSFDKYKKLKFLLKGVLNKISLFMMQSQLDKDRIIEIGGDKNRVQVTGNIKFDINFEEVSSEEISEIKEKFNIGEKKVIVAGSTHDKEEELILQIFEELDGYFLFIVPRHIDRCEEIKKKYLKNKKYIMYSDEKNEVNNSIVLVNRMGLLRKLYAVSDIAFVGGTVANIGGHSLLEPLYYGKMPLFGQNLQNVKDISKIILENKIGYKGRLKAEFIEGIKFIEERQNAEKEEIQEFFKKNRGALDKTFKNIVDII